MKNKLVIIGAGGHGKVCAEIARLNGYQTILFLDDNPSKKDIVSGTTADIERYLPDCDFFVALGNNELRKKYLQLLERANGNIVTLIHPQSIISDDFSVGEGSVIMAGVVINPGVRIGKGAIINTSTSLDHDNVIGDYVHIGVGTHLAGTVHIGEETFVGAGVTVINNISVCEDCIVGAGAVVIRDIKEKGTYVGVPVRKIK